MPILSFCVTVLFFIIINLFLSLFLASIVVILLKFKGVQVDSFEMNALVFFCCASLWIGIRVILLNGYTFENFTTIFIWPLNEVMPKDILKFLNTSVGI